MHRIKYLNKNLKHFKSMILKRTPVPFKFGLFFWPEGSGCGGVIPNPNSSLFKLKVIQTFLYSFSFT